MVDVLMVQPEKMFTSQSIQEPLVMYLAVVLKVGHKQVKPSSRSVVTRLSMKF